MVRLQVFALSLSLLDIGSTLRVSITGRCGGNSGLSCAGSTFGDCCGSHGWCGDADIHCGQGCQAEFGNCQKLEKRAGAVSVDGRCGGELGQTCKGSTFGDCCSRNNWCGSGEGFCAPSVCQKDFGSCDNGQSEVENGPLRFNLLNAKEGEGEKSGEKSYCETTTVTDQPTRIVTRIWKTTTKTTKTTIKPTKTVRRGTKTITVGRVTTTETHTEPTTLTETQKVPEVIKTVTETKTNGKEGAETQTVTKSTTLYKGTTTTLYEETTTVTSASATVTKATTVTEGETTTVTVPTTITTTVNEVGSNDTDYTTITETTTTTSTEIDVIARNSTTTETETETVTEPAITTTTETTTVNETLSATETVFENVTTTTTQTETTPTTVYENVTITEIETTPTTTTTTTTSSTTVTETQKVPTALPSCTDFYNTIYNTDFDQWQGGWSYFPSDPSTEKCSMNYQTEGFTNFARFWVFHDGEKTSLVQTMVQSVYLCNDRVYDMGIVARASGEAKIVGSVRSQQTDDVILIDSIVSGADWQVLVPYNKFYVPPYTTGCGWGLVTVKIIFSNPPDGGGAWADLDFVTLYLQPKDMVD